MRFPLCLNSSTYDFHCQQNNFIFLNFQFSNAKFGRFRYNHFE
nr:MAG TPA: hypothetical protein [Caudoviricetes sp.]